MSHQMYRLRIDVSRIRSNMLAEEGVLMPESAIRAWLASAGFEREPDGDGWLADRATLICLQSSEILDMGPALPVNDVSGFKTRG